VQLGVTLYGLSVRYGVTMRALQVANCLTSLELQAGQTLKVPPTLPNPDSYYPPEGCDNPQIQITAPRIGQDLRSPFTVLGLADYSDFGYYELQVKHAGGAVNYHTVFQNQNRVSSERALGTITFLANYITGDYWVRVAVFDARAQMVGSCALRVHFIVN
jgi:LysM repeat protein